MRKRFTWLIPCISLKKVDAVLSRGSLFVDLPDSDHWEDFLFARASWEVSIERSIIFFALRSSNSPSNHNALSLVIYTSVFTKLHIYRISLQISFTYFACVFVCLRVGMCTCLSAFVYVSYVLKQLDLMHVVFFTTWSLCRKPSKRYNLNVILFFLFLNKSKNYDGRIVPFERAMRVRRQRSSILWQYYLSILWHHF